MRRQLRGMQERPTTERCCVNFVRRLMIIRRLMIVHHNTKRIIVRSQTRLFVTSAIVARGCVDCNNCPMCLGQLGVPAHMARNDEMGVDVVARSLGWNQTAARVSHHLVATNRECLLDTWSVVCDDAIWR